MKGTVNFTEILEKIVTNYRECAAESISQHDGRIFFPVEVVKPEYNKGLEDIPNREESLEGLSIAKLQCYPTLEKANEATFDDGLKHEGYIVTDAYSGQVIDCVDRNNQSTIDHLQTTGIETYRRIVRDIREYVNAISNPDTAIIDFDRRHYHVLKRIAEETNKAYTDFQEGLNIGTGFGKAAHKYIAELPEEYCSSEFFKPCDVFKENHEQCSELNDKIFSILKRICTSTGPDSKPYVNIPLVLDDVVRADWLVRKVRKKLKKGYEVLAQAFEQTGRGEEAQKFAEKAESLLEAVQ